MKYRTTQKAIRSTYNTIISVNYCKAQFLLNCENPVAYTAGANGWNADIYNLGNGVAIVTGYSPFGNIHPDYDITKKYEDKSQKIISETYNDYNAQKTALQQLIKEFISEVTTK